MGRRVVRADVMRHGAKNGKAVRPRRKLGEMFAHPQTHRPRRDGLKDAANFRRRVGLRIEGVVLRGSAPRHHEDDRFLGLRPSLAFRTQQLRQRQSNGSQTARNESLPACELRSDEF